MLNFESPLTNLFGCLYWELCYLYLFNHSLPQCYKILDGPKKSFSPWSYTSYKIQTHSFLYIKITESIWTEILSEPRTRFFFFFLHLEVHCLVFFPHTRIWSPFNRWNTQIILGSSNVCCMTVPSYYSIQ